MEPNGFRLKRSTVYCVWLLLGCLVFLHLLPYLNWYKVPHPDLFKVVQVINNIRVPEWYANSTMTDYLSNFFVSTAPVYFYGLAYPLSLFLPGKWVVLTIGTGLMILSGYLAGLSWSRWRHVLSAVLVVVVLLVVEGSPLEGNRRSFTALFVLAAMVSGVFSNYLAYTVMTALAAGVYPPAALILIMYYFYRLLPGVIHRDFTTRAFILRLGGLCSICLFVLSPYLARGMLDPIVVDVNFYANPIKYDFHSLNGLIKTFLLGDYGSYIGALFVVPIHLDLFFIFLTATVAQWLYLRDRFRFPYRYGCMMLAGLTLWLISHFAHPLLYIPFKYSRLTLLLPLLFPVARNLPLVVHRLLGHYGKRYLKRVCLYLVTVVSLVIYLWYQLGSDGGTVLTEVGVLGSDWWEFVLVVPFLLSLMVVVPESSKGSIYRSILVLLVFCGVVVLPAEVPEYNYRGVSLSSLQGLFEELKQSSPGSRIAGPPDMMKPTATFGQRPNYNGLDRRSHDVFCERNEAYWKALFAENPNRILRFMKEERIDFLLVDRQPLIRNDFFGTLGCVQSIDSSIKQNEAFLNQDFEQAVWSLNGRLYLLTPRIISSVSQGKNES
ncbi:MAG: hypothetical protein ABEH89_00870 [bacterium]